MKDGRFSIALAPTKRGKAWIVQVYIWNNGFSLLDQECSFKTKRDAKLFTSGWLTLRDCLKREPSL